MHIMHATVLEQDELFLWAEDTAACERACTSRRVLQRGAPHPYAAEGDDAARLVVRLLDLPEEAALSVSCVPLHLPTAVRGPYFLPLPSPQLATHAADDARLELTPWSISGCVLRASEATLLLAHLPLPPAEGLRTAPDLDAWSAASRWVLSLLRRERFVPDLRLEAQSRKGPRAAAAAVGWLGALDAPGDVHALRRLAAALPPSGYCHAPDTAGPRDLLTDFVNRAVDELARHWIGRGGLSPRAASQWPAATRQWVDALVTGASRVESVLGDLGGLEAQVRRWQRELLPADRRLDFRTGFSLAAPPDADGPWPVEIYLEAVDEPAVVVPAREVWDGDPLTLERGRHRLEHPQEKLLADLGRALRVFPALERFLAEPRPSGGPLGLADASQFIRSTAWLLQDAGFAVRLPAFATDPSAAPRLQLTARENDGPAGFGLEALLQYEWRVALGADAMDPREFRRLAEQKIPLVRLRDEWSLVEPTPAAQMLELWESHDRRRLTLRDALHLAAGAETEPAVELSFDGALAALGDPRQVPPLEVPAGLQAQLRPYQQHGVAWMADRLRRGLGACLADDMGLGKTIQMITLLLHDRAGDLGYVPLRPWLLVCPMSLVGNWIREMERFAPTLRVAVHHGRSRESFDGVDVVLTTYGLAGRDRTVHDFAWRGIALDEAQNIKNHDSRQARGVRSLQATHRIAMSGTPVENRLSDLWSIMDFLNPGLLGTIEAFRRRFAVPIERYGDEARRERLRRAVAPFLLRRVKTDPSIVPDLPEKLERKVYCPLTREQASLYEATVRDRLQQIDSSDGIARRGVVLSTMLRLKQICNHPTHFLDDGGALFGRSGKLARLEEMLDEVLASGERALVFTQFREWGKRMSEHLAERFGVEVPCLHGETSREERDRLVMRFQSEDGPPIFVLSVKAGGVGLNLTRATHIFHFDRWWNPAVENQATDRAFRIGQKSNVQVHKFVCLGTLEESIDRLLESKRGLAESVVGSGEAWLTELSTGELREMFTLREGAVEEDE